MTVNNEIINDYLDNINFVDNYDEAYKEFDKFCQFLKEKEFKISIKSCTKLIKNNGVLNHLIKDIVDYNVQNNNNLINISTNDYFNMFIECYCIINNIDMIVSYPDDFEFEPGEEYGDINLCKLYLREISKFPLLTKEEEFNLSKKIADGNKQARKDLINSNLRLVVSIAKYYKSSGLDLMDLIQSGNIGLTKAADRFNVLKGYKFSTYAVWWIKQSILKEIKNTSRNIKLPNHVIDSISKYKELARMLELKLNREPTSKEILAEMNIDDGKNYFLPFVNDDTTSQLVLIMYWMKKGQH